MRAIAAIAAKDLRILLRIKAGLVFTIIWPLTVAIFFGMIFAGDQGGTAKIPIALADRDRTSESTEFISRLEQGGELNIRKTTSEHPEVQVRAGQVTAAVIILPGFGSASRHMFYGEPPQVEIWGDPGRKAESSMIQGILLKYAAQRMQQRMADPKLARAMVGDELKGLNSAPGGEVPGRVEISRFLNELDLFLSNKDRKQGSETSAPQWEPLRIETKSAERRQIGPRNAFDYTFPQGILWGIIGCTMSFSIGLVSERTHGTFIRLRMAPLTRAQLLAGKALACFTALLVVELLLFFVGATFFHVRPASPALLAMAAVSSAAAFVGIMMLAAACGKTEQAAAGVGWAVMLPLAMLGGGMIPLFVMPSWMATASRISPVRWAILAFEGSLWRGFSFREMLLPCGILLATGIICFLLGTKFLRTD